MITDKDFLLIIDVEATCWDASDSALVPKREAEIIEIGAVLLNTHNMQIEDEFQTFVQPVVNRNLSGFCKSLTSISQENVDCAPQFPEALRDIIDWVGSIDYVFCSWSTFDKKLFHQQCTHHKVNYPFGTEHIDLREWFNPNKKYSMKNAMRELGLKMEGIHHRGIDDARNIAEIVRKKHGL